VTVFQISAFSRAKQREYFCTFVSLGGLGSVSLEQAGVIIKDSDDNTETHISTSDYIFQQGDIYQLAKIDKDGSLFNNDMGSPGVGIKKHGVFLYMVNIRLLRQNLFRYTTNCLLYKYF